MKYQEAVLRAALEYDDVSRYNLVNEHGVWLDGVCHGLMVVYRVPHAEIMREVQRIVGSIEDAPYSVNDWQGMYSYMWPDAPVERQPRLEGAAK